MRSLDDIDIVTSDKIGQVISRGLVEARSLTDIREKLVEVLEITESRANVIARTESQRIQTLARENSYNKIIDIEEARFKWIGPRDKRTTPICERITRRTRNGVSLEKLKGIVQDEADAKFYNSMSPFSPHWNCRHTFVRVK